MCHRSRGPVYRSCDRKALNLLQYAMLSIGPTLIMCTAMLTDFELPHPFVACIYDELQHPFLAFIYHSYTRWDVNAIAINILITLCWC